MPMLRGVRTLNAIEAGTLTGSGLETLLTSDAGRVGDLRAIFNLRGQSRRIANSEQTMSSICASGKAFDALLDTSTSFSIVVPSIASSILATNALSTSAVSFSRLLDSAEATVSITPTFCSSSTAVSNYGLYDTATVNKGIANTSFFNSLKISPYYNTNIKNICTTAAGLNRNDYADMAAVAASTTAMTAIAASSTAMTAIAASSTAKLAVYNSDVALTAILANTNAISTVRQASGYSVVTTLNNTGTSSRAIPVPDTAGLYVIFGYSTSDPSTGATISVNTLRSGSTASRQYSTTAAGATASTAALAVAATPVSTPFTAVSTDTSTQAFSFGLLRCDV